LQPAKEKVGPHQAEWDDMLAAIRRNEPYNEAERAAYANMTAIMGRAAIHMGRIITWDEMMASNYRFCSNVADLTADSPSPARADAEGRYPVPIPGPWTEI